MEQQREIQQLPTLVPWKDVIPAWLECFALCVACKRSHEGSGRPWCFLTKWFQQSYTLHDYTALYQLAMVLIAFQKMLAFQGGGMMNTMGKGGKGGGAKGPLPLESIGFGVSCHPQYMGSRCTLLNKPNKPRQIGWHQGFVNWPSEYVGFLFYLTVTVHLSNFPIIESELKWRPTDELVS